jgi:hypothetical protein
MGFAVRLQWDLNSRGVTYDCLGYRRTGSSIPGAEAGHVSQRQLGQGGRFRGGARWTDPAPIPAHPREIPSGIATAPYLHGGTSWT